MKKLSALIALVFINYLTVSAQLVIKGTDKKRSHPKLNNDNLTRKKSPAHTSNSVLWSDDFSSNANWVISHEPGTDGDWVIGLTGPAGAAAINTIQSATASNGFAKFDSDSMCTGNQIGNLTTANSIDLSANPSVKLEFSQYYARYYDSTYVFVSNDNVNWTKFEVNGNLLINEFSGNNIALNPDIVSIDISSVAGIQSTVWIRFQFYSPSTIDVLAGCAYSWMIDDVNISELSSVDAAAQPLAFGGEYSIISLLNTTAFELNGKIINKGSSPITSGSLTFNVYNSTGQVYTDAATLSATINVGDTSAMLTSAGAFAPTDTGVYIIEQISVVAGDGDATNDTAFAIVIVDDSINARDYMPINPSSYIPGGSGFNGNPGVLGQVYHIQQTSQVTSGSFFLEQPVPGDSVSLILYPFVAGLPDTTAGVESEAYVITPQDTLNGAFLTLQFNPPVNVSTGDYFLGVHQIDTNLISLGVSNNIFNDGKMFFNGGAGWIDVGSLLQAVFILRLNNPSSTLVGIDHVTTNDNFSVYPNPSKGMIRMINKGTAGKVYVNVVNTSGAAVKSIVYPSFAEETIDLSGLASGTYTIQFISGKDVFNERIVLINEK